MVFNIINLFSNSLYQTLSENKQQNDTVLTVEVEFWHWRLRLTIGDGPLTFILML